MKEGVWCSLVNRVLIVFAIHQQPYEGHGFSAFHFFCGEVASFALFFPMIDLDEHHHMIDSLNKSDHEHQRQT